MYDIRSFQIQSKGTKGPYCGEFKNILNYGKYSKTSVSAQNGTKISEKPHYQG